MSRSNALLPSNTISLRCNRQIVSRGRFCILNISPTHFNPRSVYTVIVPPRSDRDNKPLFYNSLAHAVLNNVKERRWIDLSTHPHKRIDYFFFVSGIQPQPQELFEPLLISTFLSSGCSLVSFLMSCVILITSFLIKYMFRNLYKWVKNIFLFYLFFFLFIRTSPPEQPHVHIRLRRCLHSSSISLFKE